MKPKGDPVEGERDVRLDKWLWAARFYKTRAGAHAAIEAGRVFIDDHQAKPGRKVRNGQRLLIRTPAGEYQITIQKIVAHRVSASLASALYVEDPESRTRRDEIAQLRRAARLDGPRERPNTQDRQRLRRLKEDQW